MAVQAIGAVGAAVTASRGSVSPVGRSVAVAGQTNSAASTIVVSKVTVTNRDGSTTTTITYADGHTETETIPAKLSGKQQNPGGSYGGGDQAGQGGSEDAAGAGIGSARGSLVDILA